MVRGRHDCSSIALSGFDALTVKSSQPHSSNAATSTAALKATAGTSVLYALRAPQPRRHRQPSPPDLPPTLSRQAT